MSLLVIGMDEAGYGPMLGPLCVGVCAVRVASWSRGDAAPDLWSELAGAVCRKGGDKRGRIAVDDSKKLKLANDGARHPLTHLERGVLAFLAQVDGASVPVDDAALLAQLGAEPGAEAWYAGEATALPVAGDAGAQLIARNMLAGALRSSGVTVEWVGCRVIGEGEFNAELERSGSKATTTMIGLREHLSLVWERWGVVEGEAGAGGGEPARVVLDRQGGRTDYARFLMELLPSQVAADLRVRAVQESAELCRYEIDGSGADGRARRLSVLVMPEAEAAHLPVALASMCAKYVRELLMARWNRYWSAKVMSARGVERDGQAGGGTAFELRATAGYVQDARRWLSEAGQGVSAAERRALIRRA